MERYIDADDLRHRVLYFADARNLNGNHEQAKAYNHCLCMIDEQKTANAVLVELKNVREMIDKYCNRYCNFYKYYFGRFKDADVAMEHLERKCENCPLKEI